MASPVLVSVVGLWSAIGKTPSFHLVNDGSFHGYMHPSGWAYQANLDPSAHVARDITFLPCNNRSSGKWYLCAGSRVRYRNIQPGSRIPCELLLVLGVTMDGNRIRYQCLRWKSDLSPYSSLWDALIRCTHPFLFIRERFDITILSDDSKSLHLRPLNQCH